jgi:sulfur oxidation c-type cytochrome SoxX
VGAERRIATVVAMGMVLVSTIVLVYLFNEENRRDTEASAQIETSLHRAAQTYASNCVVCHGPEGLAGEGRQGIPLNTPENQTTDPTLGEQRTEVIQTTIERGRGAIMPAWLNTEGGPLNQQQVNDLVLLIREGAWDLTLEADIEHNVELHGVAGTSTVPPQPTPADPAELGKTVFEQNCIACHKSNDFPDGGTTGPDLTGLGAMETTPVHGQPVDAEYLTAWISNPQELAPGTIMPAFGTTLTPDQLAAVVDYLLSLE